MGRARRTERGEEGRKSRKRLERERERGQKGRGGRRKQKQQQLEKPESGRKWGVVNRALAGSPTAPLTAPACSPGLGLHLTATRLAWHHNDGRAMSEAAERPPQQAMRRQAKLEGWKSVSWIGRSYTSKYMGGTPQLRTRSGGRVRHTSSLRERPTPGQAELPTLRASVEWPMLDPWGLSKGQCLAPV